jgi:hypothetical protein
MVRNPGSCICNVHLARWSCLAPLEQREGQEDRQGKDQGSLRRMGKLYYHLPHLVVWRVYAEYQEGNAVFLLKINGLAASYDAIRRTRGDGNCFFRSFIFGYIENLVKTKDITERNRWETRGLPLCNPMGL